jgi:hypothetical protein
MSAGKTCPGASEICSKICYAKKGYYSYTSVKQSYARNEQLRTFADWESKVIDEIKHNKVKTFRIHASGDFDSVNYILKWLRIVQSCPDTNFYAYTRSWAEPYMLDALLQLSAQANMQLWWSTDKSMPEPPRNARVKIAYVSVDSEDAPIYPVDLVFRHKPGKVPIKKMGVNNALVCPVENGVTYKIKMTCERCGFCFSKVRKESCVLVV